LTILVTFLLIGIWHGVGLEVTPPLAWRRQHRASLRFHYYTIFLKKRLGREGFKAYNENRWIRGRGHRDYILLLWRQPFLVRQYFCRDETNLLGLEVRVLPQMPQLHLADNRLLFTMSPASA